MIATWGHGERWAYPDQGRCDSSQNFVWIWAAFREAYVALYLPIPSSIPNQIFTAKHAQVGKKHQRTWFAPDDMLGSKWFFHVFAAHSDCFLFTFKSLHSDRFFFDSLIFFAFIHILLSTDPLRSRWHQVPGPSRRPWRSCGWNPNLRSRKVRRIMKLKKKTRTLRRMRNSKRLRQDTRCCSSWFQWVHLFFFSGLMSLSTFCLTL